MSPAELLLALNECGITVNVRGDQLHLQAPHGALTNDLRASLADMKAEMIAFLECDRVERLEQVEAETRRECGILDQIDECLGTEHPAFDEQLIRRDIKLREYEALSDLLFARQSREREPFTLGKGWNSETPRRRTAF